MSLLIPILILLAGAALVAAGARLKFRYTPILGAMTAAAAMAALTWLRRDLPQEVVALAWRPVSLFGTPITLSMDEYAWALGLAALVPLLAACARWLAQPPPARFYPALMLAMSAVFLVVASAANLLALVWAWGFLDLIYCVALLAREGRAGSQRAEMVIGLNGLATLAVWAALAFLEQDNRSSYWHLMALPGVAQSLLGLAALLRLGLYPAYAWSMPETAGNGMTIPPVLVNLMPMLAGAALWIRLTVIQAAPGGGLWAWAALISALLAGLVAWVQPNARRCVPYVAIGYAGLLVLAGSRAGLPAALLTRGALAWLVGTYLLAASPRVKFMPDLKIKMLWGAPGLVAIAALLGLPLTAGRDYRLALHAGLAGANWTEWALAVLAETLLAGAALRYALASYPAPTFERKLAAAAAIASAAIAALPLIIVGVWPAAIFELTRAPGQAMDARAWIGWSLPLAGTLALLASSGLSAAGKLTTAALARPLAAWGQSIARALDLSWLYDLAMSSLRRAARFIGGLAVLVEGKAALVWTLLIIVLVLLYLQEPGR